jgi:hypothetical protein
MNDLNAMFESMASLRAAGFVGFVKVTELLESGFGAVPAAPGIYVVVRDVAHMPVFLVASPAGWLKGRDPSLPATELETRWLQDTAVLYLGKAGGAGTRATLRTRLSAYLRHGSGSRSPHWGGRAIWQLEDAADLLVAWRVLLDEEPRAVERASLVAFLHQYGQRPFANRTG